MPKTRPPYPTELLQIVELARAGHMPVEQGPLVRPSGDGLRRAAELTRCRDRSHRLYSELHDRNRR